MPFKEKDNGLLVNIRLTPNAKQNKICGIADIANDKKAIKISLTAVPEDGKANKALIDFLAKNWNFPKTSISLVSGQANRLKTVLIEGDAKKTKEQLLKQFSDFFI